MPCFVNDHCTQTMLDMEWPEIRALAEKNACVLLPLGVVEQHGPHLSLGTDTYLVYAKCVLIRDALQKLGMDAVIAPPFYWGINQATGAFPGCFTSRVETVEAMIYDIVQSLSGFGFRNVFGVNHHGDPAHALALIGAFRKAGEAAGMNARYVLEYRLRERYQLTGGEPFITALGPEVVETPDTGFLDVHAGAVETAQMLRYYPEQTDVALAESLPPVVLGHEDVARWTAGSGTRGLTPDGYLGEPARHAEVVVQFENYADGIAKYIRADSV